MADQGNIGDRRAQGTRASRSRRFRSLLDHAAPMPPAEAGPIADPPCIPLGLPTASWQEEEHEREPVLDDERASDRAPDRGEDEASAIQAALARIRERLLSDMDRDEGDNAAEPARLDEPVADSKAGLETDAEPDRVETSPVIDEPAGPDMPQREPAIIDEGKRPHRVVPLYLACAFVGVAIGLTTAFMWPSSYVASAEVAVDPRSRPGLSAQDGELALSDNAGRALVESHMRLVRSGSVLGPVAAELDLTRDREFNGHAQWLPGLAHIFGDRSQAADRDALERTTRQNLARSLTVERAGDTYGMVIHASTSDPQKSARLANSVAQAFVTAEAGIANGSDVSPRMLEQLRSRLDHAEAAIVAFRSEEGIEGDAALPTEAEIARASEELARVRDRVQDLERRVEAAGTADIDAVIAGSLPDDAISPALSSLRERYSGLRQEADRMSVRLGPRHPDRQALDAQLQGVRGQVGQELQRFRSLSQSDLERAARQEEELATRLADMNGSRAERGGQAAQLASLEREAQAAGAAYEDMRQRLERGEGDRAATPGARIIANAEPPLSATGLSYPAGGLFGLAAGLLAATGIALSRRRDGNAGHATLLREEAMVMPPDENERASVEADKTVFGHAQPGEEWPGDTVDQDFDDSRFGPGQIHVTSMPHGYSGPVHPMDQGAYQQPFHAAQQPHRQGSHPHHDVVPPSTGQPQFEGHAAECGRMDPHTEAAIDEIRASLREFREVLREFADRRDNSRDFGT